MDKKTNAAWGARLREHVEKIEDLELQKASIAETIKDCFAVAKSEGYDAKAMRQAIRRRKMTKAERDDEDAMVQLYEGHIYGLDGTPLGEAAKERMEIERLSRVKRSQDSDDNNDADNQHGGTLENNSALKDDTPDEAKQKGYEAAKDGRSIFSNPYPPRTLNRVHWEEGYLSYTGESGMVIPESLRRKKLPKDERDEKHTLDKGWQRDESNDIECVREKREKDQEN